MHAMPVMFLGDCCFPRREGGSSGRRATLIGESPEDEAARQAVQVGRTRFILF